MDLVELLKMSHVHAENVAKTVAWLRRELDEAGIPFAVVGGLALPYHGYLRFTEDIDILTTKEGLDRIHKELVGRGLATRFAGARKSLRDTTHNVRIDVITAGEHAGAETGTLVFPDPTSDAFMVKDELRIPKLETLIAFKLASGVWGKRAKDLGDVQELIKANRLTKRFASKLQKDLRPKFLELLDLARGEKTIE